MEADISICRKTGHFYSALTDHLLVDTISGIQPLNKTKPIPLSRWKLSQT